MDTHQCFWIQSIAISGTLCASELLFFVAASPGIGIGQFARLLLTVVMVAISQAPSPESNPNSPLPVNGKVVNYTTFNLIGGKFVQQRVQERFRDIRLPQQFQLP